MCFYYIIFFILIILYLLGEYNRQWRLALLIIATIMLSYIAAFRGEGVDRDYGGYIDLYNAVMPMSHYLANPDKLISYDPAFVIISSVIKYSLNDKVIYLFVIFAVLGVTLNAVAIKRMSSFWLLSILLYYSNYYLLHEMTQIRVGVACGFLLLSIPSIVGKKPMRYLMYMAAATMFHYSALIFLPLYFLNPKKLNQNLYLLILLLPMLLMLTKLSLHPLFTLLGQDNPLTQRYYIYTYLMSQGELARINLFNVIILLNLALGVLFIVKWQIISAYNKYAVVIIKTHICSVALFYLFYDIGAFAFRFMEILNVIQAILIPFVIYIFKEKRIVVTGVIVVALSLLSLAIYHTQLLMPCQ